MKHADSEACVVGSLDTYGNPDVGGQKESIQEAWRAEGG